MRPSADNRAAATAVERYDRVAASPHYQVALAHTPTAPVGADIAMGIVIAVVGVAFLIFSQGMMSSTGGVGQAGGLFRALFAIVPIIFVVAGIVFVVRALSFARAPVERSIEVVVDERTRTSGGGDSSVRTHYYATVQARDGRRRELETYGWLAGRIAAGDAGVAFVKGTRLIDFVRIDVES